MVAEYGPLFKNVKGESNAALEEMVQHLQVWPKEQGTPTDHPHQQTCPRVARGASSACGQSSLAGTCDQRDTPPILFLWSVRRRSGSNLHARGYRYPRTSWYRSHCN